MNVTITPPGASGAAAQVQLELETPVRPEVLRPWPLMQTSGAGSRNLVRAQILRLCREDLAGLQADFSADLRRLAVRVLQADQTERPG